MRKNIDDAVHEKASILLSKKLTGLVGAVSAKRRRCDMIQSVVPAGFRQLVHGVDVIQDPET